MSRTTGADLLSLLPAVYRTRDEDNQHVLAELVDVIAAQVRVLQAELDQMYADQFIETCADWVTAYIGDLIGYQPLTGSTAAIAAPRADVAHTIRSRRRKGTATMLEQVARDVTGWPARALEMFERVVWTQYENHIRRQAAATPDLRNHEALGFIGGGFDDLLRTPDVRSATTAAGTGPTAGVAGGPGAIRPNLPNVGIVLWRTAAIPIINAPATAAANDRKRFRFDPLGRDRQLYSMTHQSASVTELAAVADTPLPLARRLLDDHLGDYWGVGSSLVVQRVTGATTTAYDQSQVVVSNLSDTATGWAHPPAAGTIAIDPVLGRIALGTALAAGAGLTVSYHYGEAVPVGASGRPRIVDSTAAGEISGGGSLAAAMAGIKSGGAAVIEDSSNYDLPAKITVAPSASVRLEAATSCQPSLTAQPLLVADIGADATLTLGGLLISGGSLVLNEYGDSAPRSLELRDCTLVPGLGANTGGSPTSPGSASLVVLHPFASVTLTRCIVGPVVAVEGATVTLVDCILDAGGADAVAYCGRPAAAAGGLRTASKAADAVADDGMTPGAQAEILTTTVIGAVHGEILDVSNSIITAASPAGWPAPVWAHERQQGCARFSYLPASSRVGRRFKCQPTDGNDVVPDLASTRFGDPAYGLLQVITPTEIRRGADDESEMGATHSMFIPQREENLRIRLTEYLRFGLRAGFVYAD